MSTQAEPIKKKSRRKAQPLEAANNPNALLTFATVCGLIGLCRGTIYHMIADGRFVEPVRLSSRCVRFRASDVTAWLASK